MKIALNFFAQCRAAADEVTNAATESFVNRIEQHLAEVERRLVAQPRVCPDQVLGSLADPIAAFVEPVLDAAVQQLPQRGHTYHSRDVTVFDRTGQRVAR